MAGGCLCTFCKPLGGLGVKRVFDFLGAVLGLCVLCPFLLWIAWKIRSADKGPVFYNATRVGRFGKPFRLYKFRTMVVDAEKLGASSTSDDDPRITQIGKSLRRNKLDELPQLINVLMGDMSLVGPRPEVKRFTDLYDNKEKIILTVRPGITDWASIWNSDEASVLAGEVDPDGAYIKNIRPTKLRLQLKYIRERSFRVDLKLIFLTFQALVRPQSAAVRELRTALYNEVRVQTET